MLIHFTFNIIVSYISIILLLEMYSINQSSKGSSDDAAFLTTPAVIKNLNSMQLFCNSVFKSL